jgi:hypothetical protein
MESVISVDSFISAAWYPEQMFKKFSLVLCNHKGLSPSQPQCAIKLYPEPVQSNSQPISLRSLWMLSLLLMFLYLSRSWFIPLICMWCLWLVQVSVCVSSHSLQANAVVSSTLKLAMTSTFRIFSHFIICSSPSFHATWNVVEKVSVNKLRNNKVTY